MNSGDKIYIWQQTDWPHWRYEIRDLTNLLAQVHHTHGRLIGRMRYCGIHLREEASLQILTEDVLKSSEIEGEHFNIDTVRSSIARRLGIDIGALAPADRNVEGVVDMIFDATTFYDEPLTTGRLHSWHAALFPTGYSGLVKIKTGRWRDDLSGAMQVVSGPISRQQVHFEAPPASRLDAEIAQFISWFNKQLEPDPVIKAGLAHLWFVTIHPFDDGNGRIARAIGDMALARAEKTAQRLYSLSSQIQRERKDYYDLLERTQKGSLDVTAWLEWFLGCLLRAMNNAEATLSSVLRKAQFWLRWAEMPFNARQIKLINRMLDGFEGKLTSSKWATIAKCSPDTALRDISELVNYGVMIKSHSGGRSTNYELTSLDTE